MVHSVEFKRTARKELSNLPQDMHGRVLRAIIGLSEDPRPVGAKKLHVKNLWRIRVGSYRVVYEIKDDVMIVLVIAVAHRREVYRTL